jgi:hypothetical protein
MASAKKSSSSRNRSTSGKRVAAEATPRTVSPAKSAKHFAVCIRNDDYPASLELRKLYPVLEDKFASDHGLVRVIDESGEDYLFPTEYFVRVSLPQAIEKELRKIA